MAEGREIESSLLAEILSRLERLSDGNIGWPATTGS